MAGLADVVEVPAVAGDGLADRISLGVVARVVPRDLVEDVLARTGRRERRARLLPARVVVYFTLAMCLFFDDDYEQVMRRLVCSLRWLGNWDERWRVPTSGAVSQARARLGPEPLAELFRAVAAPLARPGTRGAWLGGRRLMALDGFLLHLQDTPGNAARFGRATTRDGAPAGLPQARVVALAECGTHAVVDAALGPRAVDERTLALPLLLRSLEPGTLLTADRGFPGHDLWAAALGTGADLLWRVTAHFTLPVVRALPDGSFTSVLLSPTVTGQKRRSALFADARAGRALPDHAATTVRVVDYQVDDGETIRLITSILDPADTSAARLADAYHQRWEIESTFDEIKTHLRGPARVLRSRLPDLVEQEIWALLLAHHAIRALVREAADDIEEDPDRISFTRTLRIVRQTVTGPADFSP